MTLFEEAKARMETYLSKRKEADTAKRFAFYAEYKAIKEYLLNHGVKPARIDGWNDGATVVMVKKSRYCNLKEGQEGVLVIDYSENNRFFNFNKVIFVPLTKKKTLNTRLKYSYLSAWEFDDPKDITGAESFLEHILGDFEITDKTYFDEDDED